MNDDDVTRRTLLANERTYLAWWRTGLTALTVALAAARLIPELTDTGTTWPYTLIGSGFALLGIACILYAEQRRRAVDRSVREGGYADPGRSAMAAFTIGGAALGIALLALILAEA